MLRQRCPHCLADLTGDADRCPSCGRKLDPSTDATATLLSQQRRQGLRTRGTRSGGADQPLIPGTVLLERYRIVGLLGRGGMGEVYRADDLKLGQPVALKFLPTDVESDSARVERFLNEVRVGLRVTHPNVCRIFDLGEVQGRHFLSMEYVDGEDLASLLRRIGRLPQDKAVEVAQQLCSGLAAAHAEGVLHRDLKPANVMIDGRGRAKITDFGLASAAEEISGAEARVGTPAYMAPEQLAGEELSVRTDLYALGLVLYELFTGHRAFDTVSAPEPRQVQSGTTPAAPSVHVSGLDPSIERVILRCLESDPSLRPGSALAIAAALPGGDPLAAALAAGETPSPEMVAAAGGEGSVRPAVAIGLLLIALLGLGTVVWSYAKVGLCNLVPLPYRPTELALKAREAIASFGYSAPVMDRAFGFAPDVDQLEWAHKQASQVDSWAFLKRARPTPLVFWYRQSPEPLASTGLGEQITPTDPPFALSGMTRIWLDSEGRLEQFDAVPPQVDEAPGPWTEPNWTPFFRLADLDPARLRATRSTWNPLLSTDVRRAWVGPADGGRSTSIRVEAGSFHGRPVYFAVLPPWSRPKRMGASILKGSDSTTAQHIMFVTAFGLAIGLILVVVLLARHNIRLGRGDRQGAYRLALFVFCDALFLNLIIHHVPAFDEVRLIWLAIARALFLGFLTWLAYVGVEPFVRRIWPDVLTAWTRLLEGRVRDPMIGRHVLIGAGLGIVGSFTQLLRLIVPRWLGRTPSPSPVLHSSAAFGGLGGLSSLFASLLGTAVFLAFLNLLLLLVLRLVLRRPWLATLAYLALGTLIYSSTPSWLQLSTSLILVALTLILLTRYGLLAAMVGELFSGWFSFAFSTDPASWLFPRTVVIALIYAAIIVYGFSIAVRGRFLLAGVLQER